MKKTVINAILFLGLTTFMVSCSHQETQNHHDRKTASSECEKHIKGEYHSYFDDVEKCLEKQDL